MRQAIRRRGPGLPALALVVSILLAISLVSVINLPRARAGAAPTYALKSSSNGRYLVDQNGDPFLINADTAWFIFDKISTSDYDVYLDNRAAKGFNAIQVMAPWTYDNTNFYGEAPFTTEGDISTPDNAYWARVDTFVSKAATRGMVVNIVPLWLGFTDQQWGAVLANNSLAASYAFGQFLGNRYKNSPNVMWTIGGDHDPTPSSIYDRENQIALGIHNKAPDQLITAHAFENQSAADQYGSTSWLTLNASYTYFPEWWGSGDRPVYEISKIDYNRTTVRPFFLIESGYEDATWSTGTVEPYMVRREAFWSLLSGSTGFAYGDADVWDFNGGSPPAWQAGMDDVGAMQIGLAHRMLASRQWQNLIPDFSHAVVTSGYGTYYSPGVDNGNDYATTARTSDGSLVISYIPSTGTGTRTLTVDMTKLSGTATARWFNPVDGTYTTIGSYANSGSHSFTTPGDNGSGTNDWALIIETKPAAAGSFVTGVDMNGPVVTIDGHTWQSYSAALSAGMTVGTVTPWSGSVTPSPSTDTDTTTMLSSGIYNGSGFTVHEPIANGSYDVYLYVIENYMTNARTIDVKMEGQTVASGIGKLPLNAWKRYGPYRANVSDGALDIQELKASGAEPHLFGFSVYASPDEEFDKTALGAQWSWVRQDAAKWSLTADPGSMRITSQAGDIYGTTNDAKNILIEHAPTGDWTATTKLSFGKPTTDYQQAGLLIYQDDDNYLKLIRLHNGSNMFLFEKAAAGVTTSGSVSDGISGATVYLRIVRSGTTYSAYYSSDGTTFTQVWSSQTVSFSEPSLGLISVNGGVTVGGVDADFDYLHVD